MAIKFSVPGFTSVNQADVSFKLGAQFMFDCFALGFVQTADTGQINVYQAGAFATLSPNPQGYNIWRMNDAMQASYPIYMKFEYLSWGGASASHGFWLTVGTGSDGAGNLTGIFVSRFQQTQGNASGGVVPCYGAGGTNWVTFAMTSNSQPLWLSIERTVDATGTVTGEGVIITHGGAGGVTIQATSRYGVAIGTQPAAENGIHVVLTSQNPSSFGINVGVSLVIPMAGVAKQPGYGVLALRVGDFVMWSSISLSVYGATHTYMRLGDGIQSIRENGAGALADPNLRVAIRYE